MLMSLPTILHVKGVARGKLTLEYSGRLIPEKVLETFPEYKKMLDEIKEKGWRYVYIEISGKSLIDLEISDYPCKVIPYGVWAGPNAFTLDIDLGRKLPELKVGEVEQFRINIASKSYPRIVTVDLAKQVITYIDENFWNWKDEWKDDEQKLQPAREAYEVVKWLVEEKKFKLHEEYRAEKYQEIKEKFDKMLGHGGLDEFGKVQ
jgi:hypothetical protein